MPVSLVFNSTSYLMPQVGDSGGWGQPVTAWFTDVSANALTLSSLASGLPTLTVGSGGLTITGNTTANTLTVSGLSTLAKATSTGLSFGNVAAASTIDLSKHIALAGTTVGFDVTTSRLNYVVPSGTAHKFVINAVDVATIDNTGLTTTSITASSGINTGTLTATGATSLAALTASGALSVAGAVTGAGFAAMAASTGRNLIHNSMFRVFQRGTGAFTSSGIYTADRWAIYSSVSTQSVTLVALADADRTALGDETAEVAFQSVCGGTAGAADYVETIHRIEDVKRLSGKSVTISFWAKANTGTPKVGFYMQQLFGSGGSPSTLVSFGSQNFTLSATWTRYMATIAVPSTIGKTFGTVAGSDFTQMGFTQSSGSTNNVLFGTIGVQSYTLSLWGVQLEFGTLATPLEKPDFMSELATCQRFYSISSIIMIGEVPASGYTVAAATTLPVQMRTTPSIFLLSNGNNFILNTGSLVALTNADIYGTATSNAGGNFQLTYGVACSAEL